MKWSESKKSIAKVIWKNINFRANGFNWISSLSLSLERRQRARQYRSYLLSVMALSSSEEECLCIHSSPRAHCLKIKLTPAAFGRNAALSNVRIWITSLTPFTPWSFPPQTYPSWQRSRSDYKIKIPIWPQTPLREWAPNPSTLLLNIDIAFNFCWSICGLCPSGEAVALKPHETFLFSLLIFTRHFKYPSIWIEFSLNAILTLENCLFIF